MTNRKNYNVYLPLADSDEAESCQKQLEKLQKIRDNLQKIRENLQNQIRILKAQKKTQKQQALQQNKRLTQQNTTLKGEKQQALQQNKRLTEQNTTLKGEKQQTFQQNKRLTEQNTTLKEMKKRVQKLGETMRDIENLVNKFYQADNKQKHKHFLPEDLQKLKNLRQVIRQEQTKILTSAPEQQNFITRLLKHAMVGFRTGVFPMKFSSDYYNFLKKKMWPQRQLNKNVSAKDIIAQYATPSQKGLAFEALWTILISLGFCKNFPLSDYNFYNAELKQKSGRTRHYFIEEIVSPAQYSHFLKETPIKGVNGKSDITLRHKTNDKTWVFISCKYYKHEHGDYDILPIYNTVNDTNDNNKDLRIGKKYKIYVFANNKVKARDVIENSSTIKSDENSKDIIDKLTTDTNYNVLGIDDLDECFTEFKKAVSDIPDWDAFEKKYIKKYDDLQRRLNVSTDQLLIVNKTMDIIEQGRCSPLQIYWATKFPQFGKTYCIGKLFLDYYHKHNRPFNVVIIANRPENVRK